MSDLDARICNLFLDTAKTIQDDKIIQAKIEWFDLPSLQILATILAIGFKNVSAQDAFNCRISLLELSRKNSLPIGVKGILGRLKFFAQLSWIHVNSEGWKETRDGKLQRETQIITPHEGFRMIFDINQSSARRDFIKQSLFRFVERLEFLESSKNTFQGFTMHVPYGKSENVRNRYADFLTGDKLADRIDRTVDDKAAKRKHAQQWRDLANQFVRAAANVWVTGQAAKGFGLTRPAWEGPASTLAPAVRSERQNLVKIFETYGGAVAGLAWYVFCSGRVLTDDSGRIIFDHTKPHRQYKTEDDKPKHFAMHFKTLIVDDDFQKCSREDWHVIEGMIKSEFGDLTDWGPKDGTHYSDRLGYALGEVNKLPNDKKGK